jgi:uncharacterized protein
MAPGCVCLEELDKLLLVNWSFCIRSMVLGQNNVRIAVLSDTHVHSMKEIPASFLEMFKSFDMVIHLGDFVSPELVEYFRGFNNFYGIAGNHDPRAVKALLPSRDVIEVKGKRLGLLHGYWSPFCAQQRSLIRFRKERVDAILYGHTHVIRNEKVGNILFFNPGSALALWPAPWKTIGVLNIGENIKGEIVSLAGKGPVGFSRFTDAIVDRNTVIKWICGAPRAPDYAGKTLS